MNLSRVKLLKKKYKKEILQSIKSSIKRADFINGDIVGVFEKKIAKITNFKYAISTGSGSDALYIALASLNLDEDCEVLTTSFSFIASASSILRASCRPIFADINNNDCNINLDSIKSKITPKTKAIIAVELFGNPLENKLIKFCIENNLHLIIDAAQSFRKNILNEGFKESKNILAIASFFPTKILGAFGDGGAIFCNDINILQRIKSLKNHGMSEKRYNSDAFGILSRLDTLQASILMVKLKHLDKEIKQRRSIARRYIKALSKLDSIKLFNFNKYCVFSQFSIICRDRTKVIEVFNKNNIPYAIYYPLILPLQKVFTENFKKYNFQINLKDFNNALLTSSHILSLPMDVSNTDIKYIYKILKSID